METLQKAAWGPRCASSLADPALLCPHPCPCPCPPRSRALPASRPGQGAEQGGGDAKGNADLCNKCVALSVSPFSPTHRHCRHRSDSHRRPDQRNASPPKTAHPHSQHRQREVPDKPAERRLLRPLCAVHGRPQRAARDLLRPDGGDGQQALPPARAQVMRPGARP